jgi:hypothetical protein
MVVRSLVVQELGEQRDARGVRLDNLAAAIEQQQPWPIRRLAGTGESVQQGPRRRAAVT